MPPKPGESRNINALEQAIDAYGVMERNQMHALLILSLLTFSAVGAVLAQTHSDVICDNAHVRVLKTTIEPRQPAPLQERPLDRVSIYLDGGQLKRTTPDGKFEKLEFKSGDVRWSPAGGPYIIENTGDQAFQLIEIELKGKPQPSVAIPGLDPLKIDPKHYALELENDHVRVVRVRFGPLENGVVHQHVRNYLVVYMTKQTKGDRGEVRLHLDEGTTTHTENNPLKQPVERIAVELK